jgi:hypothetical protein
VKHLALALFGALCLSFLLQYNPLSKAATTEPVACLQIPALTGDTTSSAGSCATTGALHRISTQTISAGATIQFTGLATYDRYQLFCNGVFPATASINAIMQVGEGAGPTWNTTGSYLNVGDYLVSDGTTTTFQSQMNTKTGTSFLLVASPPNTIAGSMTLSALFFSMTQTNVVKHIRYEVGFYDGTQLFATRDAGAWVGDTGAITAIRIMASSGNITGTCSLYALVP